MLGQLFYKLTGLALLLTFAGVAAPALAGPEGNGQLISQLEGHDTFQNQPQLDRSQFVIGTVKAVVGPILFIRLEKPVTLGNTTHYDMHVEGSAMAGDDVMLRIDGDQLVYEGTAHPAWITRLKLKDASDYSSNRSQIWKELDQTREVGLPPLPPEQRTFVSEPAPAPAPVKEPVAAPVRGLW